MKRRTWDSKSKARIVLEGLQGRSVASICNDYQITQSMYYRWRDTFLANADQVFETGTTNRREERLTAENQKLKQAVGELTLELKKTIGKHQALHWAGSALPRCRGLTADRNPQNGSSFLGLSPRLGHSPV